MCKSAEITKRYGSTLFKKRLGHMFKGTSRIYKKKITEPNFEGIRYVGINKPFSHCERFSKVLKMSSIMNVANIKKCVSKGDI